MRGFVKLGVTAIAAVLVAEGAVWLLRPRDEIVEGAAVAEQAYFPKEQLERARAYRRDQRVIFAGTLATQGVLLLLLASGRPAPVGRALERAGGRPLRGAALAGAGISLGLAAATLPFGIASHERAVDAGLSTQSLAEWGSDLAKSSAIGVVFAAAGAALAIALIRRFPRRWWIGATGAVIAFELVFVWLAPVLLAPVFNKFEPLEEGALRSEVLALGDKAGVEIGEVYRIDESRRTTALNAYVDGIGSTKRVVLYDTLIEGTEPAEARSVVAHELGHVDGRDIPRGLLWVAISAPLALLATAVGAEMLARRRGAELGSPAGLPALALALGVTALVIGAVGTQLSRAVEARADTFALELTDDPEALISVQKRLAERNLSDPDPPGALHFLLGSHPSAVERIGAAEAWRQGERP